MPHVSPRWAATPGRAQSLLPRSVFYSLEFRVDSHRKGSAPAEAHACCRPLGLAERYLACNRSRLMQSITATAAICTILLTSSPV